ncbi:MAG: hypothetical protein ACK4NR_06940 [Micavibrio sp.]
MTHNKLALTILFIACLLSPWAAGAQPASEGESTLGIASDLGVGPTTQQSTADQIKNFSNKMYQRCHQTPDPTLNSEQQEEYCACLSAQIYNQALTHDERRYIATGEGTPIKDLVAYAKVYSYCMGPSVYNKFYHDCEHDKDLYKVVRAGDDIKPYCNCVASDMAQFSAEYGPTAFLMYARRDIVMEDPLEFLVRSRGFEPQKSKTAWLCRKKFGRRD